MVTCGLDLLSIARCSRKQVLDEIEVELLIFRNVIFEIHHLDAKIYSLDRCIGSLGGQNVFLTQDRGIALDNKTRRGPIGWAVQAACGKGELARAWTRGTHYHIGQTVRPTHANHFLYRLTAYITDGPLDPGLNVSGEQDPWDNHTQSVGSLTTDNHLVWQTLYDLDDPANKWCIEPLPQRAEKQTKSNATNIGQLKDDFNALLDKMRKANLLE